MSLERHTRLRAYRRCAYCGCMEASPCLVRGVPCHWVGPRLCSNPACIERAKGTQRRIEGRRAAPGTPRPKRPARYVTRDGREIHRSPWAWLVQRRKAWERDEHRCRACGRELALAEAHIDHVRERGMGGAWRDDRLENLLTKCAPCHMARHNQRIAEVGAVQWLREVEASA